MFNRDRWKEILEVLTTNIFRTLLTAFGVFWGIFILLLLLAAGKGLENGVKQDFSGVATNTVFVWTQTTTMEYDGLPKGRNYSFNLEDVRLIEEEIPQLRFVSPRNAMGSRGTNNVVYGIKAGGYRIFGDTPDISEQNSMAITSGRFLNQSDLDQKRKVAILGDGVVTDLFEADQEPLGEYVKINGVNFLVVGTYKERNGNGGNQNASRQIFIPFTTFSQAYNRGDRVGWMAITAKDGSSITALTPKILNIIKKNHRINPKDDRAVGNFDLFQEYSRVENLFGAMRWIAIVVGTLVLLSGVIGVSNIMLIVVKERTKEIGIRRALGESPFSIKMQIIMESIFLTIISGMAGVVFGTLIIFAINMALDASGPVDMFLAPSVDLGSVVGALVILIISGLLAGFIPANSAIKVKPIEALRSE